MLQLTEYSLNKRFCRLFRKVMRTIQNQISYISVKKSSNSIYQILIHGSENHPAVHTHADTHRKFINSSNTTCFFFQGANICLVVIFIKTKKGNPKDIQCEPEGARRQKMERILSPTLSNSGVFWATQI